MRSDTVSQIGACLPAGSMFDVIEQYSPKKDARI